ncbi:MAG: hypothetical protein LBU64_02685 [Planctomycetota bacterium]|nr:hypothetical protein [Planctomycetota bacterium]
MTANLMRNLHKANSAMGKSMERLSRGLRINAADDGPADPTASERLRSRIEELEGAIRETRTAGDIMDIARRPGRGERHHRQPAQACHPGHEQRRHRRRAWTK